MADRWCPLTVMHPQGRRHSLDVLTASTYDDAHLYMAHAKADPRGRVPLPNRTEIFFGKPFYRERVVKRMLLEYASFSDLRQVRAQPVRRRPLTLVLISRQYALIFCELRQKSKSSDTT